MNKIPAASCDVPCNKLGQESLTYKNRLNITLLTIILLTSHCCNLGYNKEFSVFYQVFLPAQKKNSTFNFLCDLESFSCLQSTIYSHIHCTPPYHTAYQHIISIIHGCSVTLLFLTGM